MNDICIIIRREFIRYEFEFYICKIYKNIHESKI